MSAASAASRPGGGPISQRLFPWLLFGFIAGAVSLLVVARETDPAASLASQHRIGIAGLRYEQSHNDALLFAVCGLVGVSLLRGAWQRRGRPVEGDETTARPFSVATAGAPAALLLVAAFGYFYGTTGVARPYYPCLWDAFHAFIGPKYHDELGYFGFYECIVQADEGELLADADPVTDLERYRLVPAATLRARPDCRQRFAPERWQAFGDDLAAFRLYHMGRYGQMVRDFGYNGTPTHTLFAGALAGSLRADFRTLTLMGLLDVALLCAMMAAVCQLLGWRTGCLFVLFFLVNFSDRFVHVGGSFLRYPWMALLAVGLALLARGRHALAAVALSASAMLAVFPALFLAGIGCKAATGALRGRLPAPEHRRFLAWAAVTALVLGLLGVCHGRGAGNYRDFLAKMAVHVKIVNESRVGLQYLFLSGEDGKRGALESVSRDPRAKKSPARHRHLHLRDLSPLYYPVALIALGLALLVVLRLDDLEASVLLGALLLLVLFNAVQYYWTCAAVLVLLWHRRLETAAGRAMVSTLFLLTGAVYVAWLLTGDLPFCDTVLTPLVLAVYLALCLGVLFFIIVSGSLDVVAHDPTHLDR